MTAIQLKLNPSTLQLDGAKTSARRSISFRAPLGPKVNAIHSRDSSRGVAKVQLKGANKSRNADEPFQSASPRATFSNQRAALGVTSRSNCVIGATGSPQTQVANLRLREFESKVRQNNTEIESETKRPLLHVITKTSSKSDGLQSLVSARINTKNQSKRLDQEKCQSNLRLHHRSLIHLSAGKSLAKKLDETPIESREFVSKPNSSYTRQRRSISSSESFHRLTSNCNDEEAKRAEILPLARLNYTKREDTREQSPGEATSTSGPKSTQRTYRPSRSSVTRAALLSGRPISPETTSRGLGGRLASVKTNELSRGRSRRVVGCGDNAPTPTIATLNSRVRQAALYARRQYRMSASLGRPKTSDFSQDATRLTIKTTPEALVSSVVLPAARIRVSRASRTASASRVLRGGQVSGNIGDKVSLARGKVTALRQQTNSPAFKSQTKSTLASSTSSLSIAQVKRPKPEPRIEYSQEKSMGTRYLPSKPLATATTTRNSLINNRKVNESRSLARSSYLLAHRGSCGSSDSSTSSSSYSGFINCDIKVRGAIRPTGVANRCASSSRSSSSSTSSGCSCSGDSSNNCASCFGERNSNRRANRSSKKDVCFVHKNALQLNGEPLALPLDRVEVGAAKCDANNTNNTRTNGDIQKLQKQHPIAVDNQQNPEHILNNQNISTPQTLSETESHILTHINTKTDLRAKHEVHSEQKREEDKDKVSNLKLPSTIDIITIKDNDNSLTSPEKANEVFTAQGDIYLNESKFAIESKHLETSSICDQIQATEILLDADKSDCTNETNEPKMISEDSDKTLICVDLVPNCNPQEKETLNFSCNVTSDNYKRSSETTDEMADPKAPKLSNQTQQVPSLDFKGNASMLTSPSTPRGPLTPNQSNNIDNKSSKQVFNPITKGPPIITIKTEPITDYYYIEARPFARGKFAQVKRCVHIETKECFAAKCIKKRRRLVDIRHEILLEIEALKLSYLTDRIVKLYEVFETASEIILVLEMANGGELQRVLDDEENIEEDIAKRMIRQILEGLVHLHDHEIAHLDIKPQNLLLTKNYPEGDIKLCDFGISRRISKDCEIREICGTPDYVAPEILRYDPISLATDMWSLGVLTYVLLSGYSPFGGENKQQTFCNITQATLDFPGEIFNTISSEAIDFMRKLMDREPRNRMTSREARNHPWLNQ